MRQDTPHHRVPPTRSGRGHARRRSPDRPRPGPWANSGLKGRSGAHMVLLEKSLLPGTVFAGYVTRPSRRSRRILRPSRKKTSVNTTRPPAGITTARSSPVCALMGTILPVECPHRPLSGGDVSRSSATARIRQARHTDSVPGRRCPRRPGGCCGTDVHPVRCQTAAGAR